MCQVMIAKFSCGHEKNIGDPITCDRAEESGEQCEEPVETPISQSSSCAECLEQESAQQERDIIEQSIREHDEFKRQMGVATNDEEEEEVLQRVLQESMEGVNISGDFDDDEVQKALQMSRSEFPWAAYITEEQWNRSAQQPAEFGYRGGESSRSTATISIRRTVSGAATSDSQVPTNASAASFSERPSSPPPPYAEDPVQLRPASQPEPRLEPELEVEESTSEVESNPGRLPTVNEKPFMNRRITFHRCKHAVVTQTQIKREDDNSPVEFPAIAMGLCPECQERGGAGIGKGKGRASPEP
jgi:hypothetical protein